jgi:hypothetical protein
MFRRIEEASQMQRGRWDKKHYMVYQYVFSASAEFATFFPFFVAAQDILQLG